MIDDLLRVACDKTIDEIDRIEAMKGLLLEIVNESEQLTSIQSSLIRIIADAEDDCLVRQHAAKELAFYPVASIDLPVLEILRNSKEDLDLRINLHSAVKHLSDDPRLVQAISDLTEDDALKRYL